MKIKKSELSSGNINQMKNALETDKADAKKLIDTLDDLIGAIDSKKLSGQSYDLVKNKLNEFKTILSERINLSSSIIGAINSATSSMASFMGDKYTELDEAELGSLQATISNAQTDIAALSEVTLSETTPEYNEKKVRELNALIASIREEIEKINGISTADNSAYAHIESVRDSITQYSSKINGIKESKIELPTTSTEL